MKRRVLHTVGNLELGGGQKLTALVARFLDKEQFDVSVMSFGRVGPYGERLRSDGVEVITLGIERPLRRNRPATLFSALRVFWHTMVVRRWDIVHTHMFLNAIVVTPVARLRGARVFGTVHRIYYGRLQSRIEWLLAPLQERIVVDSHAVREILRKHTHISARKYVVIHNGIDPEEFDDRPRVDDARAVLGLPSNAVVVCEIAHLAPHKGQRHLLEAFGRITADAPDARLVFVGDGPCRDQLELEAVHAGVGDRVWFTGRRSDLAVFLSAIDVLALPSEYEGFGIVQAEAMYCGKPVVATNAGGSTEVVDDGVTGLLVAFGDVDALSAALLRLATDASLRRRMGDAGRRRCSELFLAHHMAAEYATLYTSPKLGTQSGD
jgi:glycosyltransferase involved in cell wall biosynthesis